MRFTALLASLFLVSALPAQDSAATEELEVAYDAEMSGGYVDSLIAAFEYQQGAVDLAEGVATLQLPESFKFLGGEQARQLIEDVWENPPSITDKMLGAVLYADAGPYDGRTAWIVYYDPIGYVSDADAGGTDYDAMMRGLLKEDSTDNAQRVAEGYTPLVLEGWASPPYYDRERKVLHWAKEMSQEGDADNVLNYNIRVLGRRGVLILNGLSTMSKLEQVKAEVPVILDMTAFNDGHRYDQYNADTDALADQTVAGLIDGETREKVVGFVKMAAKIAIGVVLGMIVIVLLIWFLVVRRKRSRAPGI
jgi:uncharacterized membrane-anchored protein